MSTTSIDPNLSMRELLSRYPGAQRALFRKYHIGGCSSCGFDYEASLTKVCEERNLPVSEVLWTIQESHDADQRMQLSVQDAATLFRDGKAKLLDVRTQEEWDAAHIEGSTFFTRELMNEIGGWPKEQLIVFVCHHGVRSLDAAAYFAGHGMDNVRSMNGGIDAWSIEVDPAVPRYELA